MDNQAPTRITKFAFQNSTVIFLVGVLSILLPMSAMAQPTKPMNAMQAAAQREADQAIRAGRFLELRGLTNSTDDQMKAVQLCRRYTGTDSRICGEVAAFYAHQSMQALLQQQAQDGRQRPVVANQSTADEANAQQQATLQAIQKVTSGQNPRLTARASLASDSEISAFDSCMSQRGNYAIDWCVGQARREAAQAADDRIKKNKMPLPDQNSLNALRPMRSNLQKLQIRLLVTTF